MGGHGARSEQDVVWLWDGAGECPRLSLESPGGVRTVVVNIMVRLFRRWEGEQTTLLDSWS